MDDIEQTKEFYLKSSTDEDCCIFRVPRFLSQTLPNECKPQILSVGPYHHKDKILEMIQGHKQRFLDLFLETANSNGVSVSKASLESDVAALEATIRNSYSENLQLSTDDLAQMLVLDGCFILMLVLVNRNKVPLINPEDTIFTVPWILPVLRLDLLLLENQVPYIVLQTLFAKFGLTRVGVSLGRLILDFFEKSLGITWTENSLEDVEREVRQPRHLLHLIRGAIACLSDLKNQIGNSYPTSNTKSSLVLSATKLQLQGLKFMVAKNADTFLDVVLNGNGLMIPPVILDHFMVKFLFNCVALEHCFPACGDHITTYIVLMGCLMKEKEDASFICNKGIIDNLFGSDEEASRFFKDISKSVKLELSSCNLRFMFESINGYTSRRSIGCNYCGSPWVVALTIGAVVLLLVAIAQLVITCLSFGHDLRH